MVRHRRHLPALAFALSPLATACAEGGPAPSAASGAGLAVEVAPLTLPGLGDACYDVEVRNDLEALVWSRGTVGLGVPGGDTDALCASQFGNGAGGDVSYVGPCDGQDQDLSDGGVALHTVTLWVDSLLIDPSRANSGFSGAHGYTQGKLGYLALYGRHLLPADVAQNYEAHRARFGL